MDLKEKIKSLPHTPGVYIMKGAAGEILYVGKAGNIKKRVSSYFYPQRRLQERIEIMVGKVGDIEYIQTTTEAEALIYENSLIKQLSPRYNVALKDSKSYPLLKLTAGERFPRLFMTRQKKEDGALYFGPYTNAKLLREALIALRQIFPLRSCVKMPKSVCLNYHIRQCPGPCAGKIGDAAYAEIVSELRLFLEGKKEELLKRLSEKMREASAREDFEEAAAVKTRVEALSSIKGGGVRYKPAAELAELEKVLGMQGPIELIEAFDVSNIMGTDAVGSMVCFYKGRPRKSDYRRFRIREISGIDDYAMIREVVRRRYARVVEERRRRPDLILIDGGKGHLASALGELEELGLADVPAIGLAKEFEHVYTRGKREPIILPKESKALHLLRRIRDEAHRFAISYHKDLRSRRIKISELDEIRGIGPKKKKALMERFGEIGRMRTATLAELMSAKGLDAKTARAIVEHFKG